MGSTLPLSDQAGLCLDLHQSLAPLPSIEGQAVPPFGTWRRRGLSEHGCSVRGVTITYTGEELRQDDADVFLQLLHTARGHPLGSEVRFIASHMLERLKWTHNSESYNRLEACVVRLQATSVRVTVALPEGDETFYGSLLPKVLRSRKTAKESIAYWRISLDPDIVALFGMPITRCWSGI
ncbi:plasmid replication initiator TrfA [Azohydromonas australica]|uniref:plasmid replication initiator TrfA n=1 Tax=Azohydromonas australica TaxID=364039 RepID=UPI000A006AD9|nr:plasmid replication initiator TrfA [Azohydromonas australica]